LKLPELSDARMDWRASAATGLDINRDELYDGIAWRRVAAFAIDFSIILVLLAVGWILVFLSFGLLSGILALFPLVPLAYHTLMIAGSRSATLGMQFMAVEVRDQRGNRPTLLQSFAMTAIFYLSVSVTSSLVLLVALFNDRRHCLHDYLSGTVVIRTDIEA
jgi:uncharacterized RDD family membrane protein YckC